MNDLLECTGLARSSYYYAMAHPKQPTRPELWEKVAEVFSRTPNGCGHRQIAMCLRAEDGVAIAEKTVLKIMSEMGIRCGIRKETDYHRYSSYRGLVGKTFENLIGRDFKADAPWQKMGTDVTEFKQAWGKAYFAPVYDFGSKEIVAWSTSMSPNMAQQFDVLDQLVARMPDGGVAVPERRLGGQAGGRGYRAKHVAQGQLHRQRRHRAGLRPYQGRVLPRAELRELRGVQGEARGVHRPLEHEAKAG